MIRLLEDFPGTGIKIIIQMENAVPRTAPRPLPTGVIGAHLAPVRIELPAIGFHHPDP